MHCHALNKFCGIDFPLAWKTEKKMMFSELIDTFHKHHIDSYQIKEDVFVIDSIRVQFWLICGYIWRVTGLGYKFWARHVELCKNDKLFTDLRNKICAIKTKSVRDCYQTKMTTCATELSVNQYDVVLNSPEDINAIPDCVGRHSPRSYMTDGYEEMITRPRDIHVDNKHESKNEIIGSVMNGALTGPTVIQWNVGVQGNPGPSGVRGITAPTGVPGIRGFDCNISAQRKNDHSIIPDTTDLVVDDEPQTITPVARKNTSPCSKFPEPKILYHDTDSVIIGSKDKNENTYYKKWTIENIDYAKKCFGDVFVSGNNDGIFLKTPAISMEPLLKDNYSINCALSKSVTSKFQTFMENIDDEFREKYYKTWPQYKFTCGPLTSISTPIVIGDPGSQIKLKDESIRNPNDEKETSTSMETPSLRTSRVKFCGEQIGSSEPLPVHIPIPCYIPPSPPNINKKGQTLFTVDLTELLQVKNKLKRTSADKSRFDFDANEIKNLSDSCQLVESKSGTSENAKSKMKLVACPNRSIALNVSQEVPKTETELEIPTRKPLMDFAFQSWKSKLIPYSDLRCVNMKMIHIKDSNLGSCDMRYVALNSAVIKKTNMSGVDLTGADLSQAKFKYVDLSGADLTNTNLFDVVFKNCDFSDANLGKLNCDGVVFKNCTFTGTNIMYTSFNKANLRGTNLQTNNLTGCEFRHANLVRSGLTLSATEVYPNVDFEFSYNTLKKVYM